MLRFYRRVELGGIVVIVIVCVVIICIVIIGIAIVCVVIIGVGHARNNVTAHRDFVHVALGMERIDGTIYIFAECDVHQPEQHENDDNYPTQHPV